MIRKAAIFFAVFASLVFGAEHDFNIKQQRANGTLVDRVISPPSDGFLGFVGNIPQAMTLLPVITQQGITQTGTLLGGATGAGFTIDFAASTLSGTATLKSALSLDNVTNHVQTQAAIVPNTLPTAGQILIGNAGGTAYVPLSVSGHATLSSSGVLTLATSGAVAGTYTNATVTVDIYGRVTSASSGTSGGTGTVTTVSVVTANGVSAAVADPTTTPALTFTLGAITPTSVVASGAVTGSNLSGTNTGDQTTIVGITGTLAEFNAALTGADFATGGGTVTGTSTGTNTGDQTITLTGVVTGSGTGSVTTAITDNTVALTKLVNAAGSSGSLVGRRSGSAGAFEQISIGSGLTMSAGGDLSATGGTGDVVGPASSTNQAVAIYNNTTGKLLANGPLMSTGGNGAADSGKLARFGGSGYLTGGRFTAKSGTIEGVLNSTGLYFYDGTNSLSLDHDGLTASRQQYFQNADGVIALTDDIPVKAWVNFDGTSAANVSGTYARTSPSTTLTVTLTAHGHIAGHVVYLDFTTGTGVDGVYTIVSITDANNYTVTTVASTTTSGNVTELRRTINGSRGVHSVTYANSAGINYVNFTTAFSDAFYSGVANAGTIGAGSFAFVGNSATPTAAACNINVTNFAGTSVNIGRVYAQFVR